MRRMKEGRGRDGRDGRDGRRKLGEEEREE